MDIKGYETNPENYRFSSLSIYLGQKADEFEIIDEKFVLSMFSLKEVAAKKIYKDFVFKVKSVMQRRKILLMKAQSIEA